MTAQSTDEAMRRSVAGGVNTRALHMLGLRTKAGGHEYTLEQSVAAVHQHLTYPQIEGMRKRLSMDRDFVVKVLEVSPSTYSRRLAGASAAAITPAPVAERALRLARVAALAEEVLEDRTAAREWLAQPQPGLGGRVPQALLSSEFGAQEVETLLHQLDAGVYV